jgi:hypothetical protein
MVARPRRNATCKHVLPVLFLVLLEVECDILPSIHVLFVWLMFVGQDMLFRVDGDVWKNRPSRTVLYHLHSDGYRHPVYIIFLFCFVSEQVGIVSSCLSVVWKVPFWRANVYSFVLMGTQHRKDVAYGVTSGPTNRNTVTKTSRRGVAT